MRPPKNREGSEFVFCTPGQTSSFAKIVGNCRDPDQLGMSIKELFLVPRQVYLDVRDICLNITGEIAESEWLIPLPDINKFRDNSLN